MAGKNKKHEWKFFPLSKERQHWQYYILQDRPRLEESIIQSPFGLRVRFKNFRSFSAESSRDEDCVFQHQQRVGWYQPFHNLGTPLLSVYYCVVAKIPLHFCPINDSWLGCLNKIIDNPPRLCVCLCGQFFPLSFSLTFTS